MEKKLTRGFISFMIGIFFLSAAFITLSSNLMAAELWKPKDPIRVIVSSGVGSAYDILARKVSEYSVEYFGVPMIVSNSPGAGGLAAAEKIASAKPDGRTVGFCSSNMHMEAFFKVAEGQWNFSWKPEDLCTIFGIAAPPYVVVTGAQQPFKNWNDVRNHKGPIRIANTAPVAKCIPMVRDLLEHGVDVKVANFKGTPQSRLAIESGDAHLWMGASSVSTVKPIEEGKMRPLYIYNDKRDSRFPDWPTHIELGMPEKYQYNRMIRVYLTVPGTPQNILEGLHIGLRSIAEDTRVVEWGKKISLPTDPRSKEEVENHLKIQWKSIEDDMDLIKKYAG